MRFASLAAAFVVLMASNVEAASKKLFLSASKETDTGITIWKKGAKITIKATGTWKMGGFIGACSPRGFARGSYSKYNVTRAANHGALIAKIGKGAWQSIGSLKTITADGIGRLVLAPNDTEKGNNGGTLSVTITYQDKDTLNLPDLSKDRVYKKSLTATAKGGVSTIKVYKGDKLSITSSGRWKAGNNYTDGMGTDIGASKLGKRFSKRRHGALMMRVAGDDGWYYIGKSRSFTAPKTGYLEWSPNDTRRSDNSGALSVSITITRPGIGVFAGGKKITVPANTRGYVSSVRVKKGQTVYISATGRWKMGGFVGYCDAEGMSGYKSYNLVDLKHGSLILQIEGEGNIWRGGAAKAKFVAKRSGRLIFRANDKEPGNNAGSLTVTVKVK